MVVRDARAFWIVAPGRGEIRAERVAPPSRDQVMVEALFSGISRGTETLVFRGEVPVGEYGRMRAPFQDGDFPGPVKYGYSSVGRVVDGSREKVNRHVFVLYPHQTRYVVPAGSAHLLPDTVPPERAVLAANMETAVNGVWDAAPRRTDRLVVIGGGTVGCLVAWVARRTPGCEVQLVDVNPRRERVAHALGVPFANPDGVSRDADIVIHASGSADGLDLALRTARFEGTVVEMSWYGSRRVPVALGEAFHSQRLTLKSSQVGTVAAPKRAEWDHRRRIELALSLLADPALDALISGESAFDDLPRVMPQLAASPGDTLCHRIKYEAVDV